MFKNWQQEKATTALIDEAQALADRLAQAKPHQVDSYSAYSRLWAATFLAEGKDLHALSGWKPAALKSFVSATETRIAALRKQRAYDSSDGLTVWLLTACAAREPRMAPAVVKVWQHLMVAGPNADAMATDLLAEAGLPHPQSRRTPTGFENRDETGSDPEN